MAERLTIITQPLRQFAGWWVAELSGMIPARARSSLARNNEAVAVTLDDTHAIITYENGRKTTELARLLPNGTETAGRTRVLGGQALLQERVQRGKVPVCVRLPASRGLRTEIMLPEAVEQNLGQVLHFELDRRTPFTPDTVHFAYRVVGREAGQLRIELTVAPKTAVADAVALAEKLGLGASSVEIAGEAGGTPSGNLLPPREGRAHPMRRALRVGAVAAAAAAAIAIYLPVYEAHHAAVELTGEVAEARALADRAQKLKTDLAGLETADQFLTAAKSDRPSVSELLFEVTRTLPDDTWLVEFGIAGDELKISGFTASSSDLIQRVGRSRLLAEPRFRSAVTVDATAHRERFEIGAKIARKPSS